MTTNPDGRSPATLALMDQAHVTFRSEALMLAEVAHELAVKFGVVQGTADLCALLVHQHHADPNLHDLAAIAAAALMELGKTDAWREIYNQDGAR